MTKHSTVCNKPTKNSRILVETKIIIAMRLPFLLCLLLSTFLTGCTTILNIQSNVRVVDKPPFERILIVSRLPNVEPDYATTFVGAFPSQYTVCSVDISPIAFETPDELIDRQLKECNSQVMLTLDLNRNFSGGSGKYIRGYNNIYLEMTNLATGKPFWKAIVLSDVTELWPHEIVRQLVKDGVLSGKVPTSNPRYR